jgi:hypothetical protein
MSDGPVATGIFTYTRSDSVVLPQSEAEVRFAIRRSDWGRLKRCITICKSDAAPNLSGWYFFCFGIGGSTGVSILPLLTATGLAPWIVPAYCCMTGAAILLGLVLVAVNKYLNKKRGSRLDELEIDMGDIERGFGPMQ